MICPGKNAALIRLQTINVEFATDGRRAAAVIIAPCADVDLAVGDGGNGELHRKARPIARDEGTVPELWRESSCIKGVKHSRPAAWRLLSTVHAGVDRSEEHTSELQSPCNLVC